MSTYSNGSSRDTEATLLEQQPELSEKEKARQKVRDTFDGKNAYETASCWSKLFFSWTSPILDYSKKNQLSIDDLGSVRTEHDVKIQYERLQESWGHYKHNPTPNSLSKAVIRTYAWEYFMAVLWNFVVAALQLSSPFLLRNIILFIREQNDDTMRGVIDVLLLTFTQGLAYFIQEHLTFYSRMTGAKSTNAMIALIYDKTFQISNATNKKFTQGQLINFVQVDALRLQFLSSQAPMMLRLPVLISLCFVILAIYLGWSVIAGLVVIVITFYVNTRISRASARLYKRYMGAQDQRVKALSEAFTNIKMIKLYSWKAVFQNLISEKRANEMNILARRFIYSNSMITCLYFFPSLLSAVLFSVYIGFGNTLDLEVAFTVMVVLNLIKEPLRSLPQFVGQVIEFQVSMTRIQNFILVNEINPSIKRTIGQQFTGNAIEIRDGSNFHWGAITEKEKNAAKKPGAKKDTAAEESQRLLSEKQTLDEFLTLKNIGIQIRRGEFVCIIGDVASGKSSLLSTIIGDLCSADKQFYEELKDEKLDDHLIEAMNYHAGQEIGREFTPVLVSETVSYVQQSPWIQNKTIKENILFGEPLDEAKYQETIDICQLKRDLEILPAGDKTEIGEKGINLSGGQKARIGLARAVYADKQLILMDDPLSALDANVKKKIFKLVFMRKLAQKTRILVTHAVDFLHLADQIILLKKGKVVFKGSYEQVKNKTYLKELYAIYRSHKSEQESIQEEGLLNGSINTEESSDEIKPVTLDDVLTDSDEEEEKDQIQEENLRANSGHNRERNYSVIIKSEDKKEDINKQEVINKKDGKITTNENAEEARATLRVYRDYLHFQGGFKQLLATNLALTLFTTSRVAADFLVGSWTTSPDQHTRFGYYCALYFTFTILTSFFVSCRVASLMYFTWHGNKKLHSQMVDRVLDAPINLYFDQTPTGRILNKFSKDLGVLDLNLIFISGTFYNSVYSLLAIIILSIIIVPWIALFFPIIFIIVMKLYRHSIDATKEVKRIESVTKSPLLAFLQETLSGTSTIRAFKKKEHFVENFHKLLNKNIVSLQWAEGVPFWFAVRIDTIATATMTVIALFCVLERNNIDPVFLALLLTYSLTVQSNTISSIRTAMTLEARMVNAERVLGLLKVPQENVEGELPLEEFKSENPEWPSQGLVEFQNVNLRYRPTTDIVLKQLSFTVNPGEKIGIVGRTGAGKSTICLSLSRIVEIIEGQILIDNVNIRTVNLDHLRSRVTVIPQDPTMFSGTLRFNLDPLTEVTDERILEVMSAAQLDDFLQKDKDGLNQQISEGGSNLSSGEKQLICICRAILRSSKVVILDEATANIDVVTEQKIQQLIQSEFQGSTMITIAHRLNTIIQSDKVMVLSYGEIVEYDQPATLMNDPASEFSSLLREIEKEENSPTVPEKSK